MSPPTRPGRDGGRQPRKQIDPQPPPAARLAPPHPRPPPSCLPALPRRPTASPGRPRAGMGMGGWEEKRPASMLPDRRRPPPFPPLRAKARTPPRLAHRIPARTPPNETPLFLCPARLLPTKHLFPCALLLRRQIPRQPRHSLPPPCAAPAAPPSPSAPSPPSIHTSRPAPRLHAPPMGSLPLRRPRRPSSWGRIGFCVEGRESGVPSVSLPRPFTPTAPPRPRFPRSSYPSPPSTRADENRSESSSCIVQKNTDNSKAAFSSSSAFANTGDNT